MTNPTKTRRQFTEQQKQEAVALCMQEGLPCNAVAQRLGLHSSSLARWVRQARIDSGQAGPRDHGILTPARSALSSIASVGRTGNSGGRRIFSGWRQRTTATGPLGYAS
jgi:transposase-like protein